MVAIAAGFIVATYFVVPDAGLRIVITIAMALIALLNLVLLVAIVRRAGKATPADPE